MIVTGSSQPFMNLPELFESSMELVERIARGVCRRANVEGADADDFVSSARLALLENDYAILRAYEGRSSLSTFLNVVFRRLLADQRIHALGKWNVSREAARLGPVVVLLETLLRRDGRSIDEALPLIRKVDPSLTREQVEAMAARLPERTMRPRLVALPEEDVISSAEQADDGVLERETRAIAGQASSVMRDAIAALPLEDRMILRFRYAAGMSFADIARMMRLPQRPLYRRSEAILHRLRDALQNAGVDETAAADLVGSAVAELDFGFAPMENGAGHPSDEKADLATKESR